MIDPEMRSVVERLRATGIAFEAVCVWVTTGRPMSHAELMTNLESPERWTVVWIPTFIVLPANHPEYDFGGRQRLLYYSDSAYTERLENAAAEMDMVAQEATYREEGEDDGWQTD